MPVIKPQVAFFERHGSAGTGRARAAAGRGPGGRAARPGRRQAGGHRHHRRGLCRRLAGRGEHPGGGCGDGASVSRGWLPSPPSSPWPAATGRGVIVVTRSSNPEGRLVAGGGDPDRASRSRSRSWPRSRRGTHSPDVPTGTVGAVIGATLERSVFPLVPARRGNFGSRTGRTGGPARRDLPTDSAGAPPEAVLVSTSRSLLATGPDPAESAPGGRRFWATNWRPSWAE